MVMTLNEAITTELERLMAAEGEELAAEVERARSVSGLASAANDQMRVANERAKLQLDAMRLADAAESVAVGKAALRLIGGGDA